LKLPIAVLLVPVLILSSIQSARGASSPAWSVSLKAGADQPGIADYGFQYGHSTVFQGNIEWAYKWTERIESGIGTGYVEDHGNVRSVSGRISGVRQTLILIPTELYLSYQFIRSSGQLLVPFLGGGLTHTTYRRSVEGENDVTGGLSGFHARGGAKLLLNRVDPDAALRLNENWGVIHTYLLLQVEFSRIDNFGESDVDLGGWSYWGGIQCEF
jgi:hypothetical protein